MKPLKVRKSSALILLSILTVAYASLLSMPVHAAFLTDSSAGGVNSPHTMTAVATVAENTTQFKFGAAAGNFDGDSGYLHTPDSADWNFGAGDFTIDTWIYFNALPATDNWAMIYYQATDANNWLKIGFWKYSGNKYWYMINNVASVKTIEGGAQTPSLAVNTWYHFALVRSGTNFYIFENGVQNSAWSDADTIADMSGVACIGSAQGEANTFVNGNMDEVRVSKGVARWTSAFTPPIYPYTSDAYTVLLLHLQTTDTSTTATTTTTTSTTMTTTTTTTTSTTISQIMTTTYTTLWTSSTGSTQSAGASPYTWRNGVIQYTLGQSKGAIGQRQISSNGDTRAFLSYENSTGYLVLNVWTYTGSGVGGAFITSWSADQGAVLSDLVTINGYLWCVVATQNAAKTGVQFREFRISTPVGPTCVSDFGTYQTTYNASTIYRSVILDCQLFPNGDCYASYSYILGDFTWNPEIAVLHYVGTSSPISMDSPTKQTGIGWTVPCAPKFTYSSYTTRVYGMIGVCYIQTYDPAKGAQMYDYTNLNAITHILNLNAKPASPLTIFYDSEKRVLCSSYFASNYNVIIHTYILTTSVSLEIAKANPYSMAVQDCADLTASGNGYGQWIIMGLWSIAGATNKYSKFIYSLDFGVSWSDWINAPSGYLLVSNQLSRRISMPSYFQSSGFQGGIAGYGSFMEYDDGVIIVRTFQYQPNVITFSGTVTLTGLSTSTRMSTINALSTTTLTSILSQTFTTVSYLTTDQPIVVVGYSLLIIMVCVGLAVFLQKSVLAMIEGLLLGVTISSAVGLIPLWILIVALIAMVMVLLFNRSRES